jgi:hypothetical protein
MRRAPRVGGPRIKVRGLTPTTDQAVGGVCSILVMREARSARGWRDPPSLPFPIIGRRKTPGSPQLPGNENAFTLTKAESQP